MKNQKGKDTASVEITNRVGMQGGAKTKTETEVVHTFKEKTNQQEQGG